MFDILEQLVNTDVESALAFICFTILDVSITAAALCLRQKKEAEAGVYLEIERHLHDLLFQKLALKATGWQWQSRLLFTQGHGWLCMPFAITQGRRAQDPMALRFARNVERQIRPAISNSDLLSRMRHDTNLLADLERDPRVREHSYAAYITLYRY